MGLSRIFDISRRSLATYQKAMDITAHNVANASNPNYSRQRINLTTETPEVNANFIWGSGVKIADVERIRNGLVDSQIRTSNGQYSSNNQESILLSQIEQVFAEPTDLGLSNSLTRFFNSWNELAVTPNSTALRYDVIQNSQALSSKFKSVYDSLNVVKYDTLRNFTETTAQINSKLKQLQQMNVQIVDSASTGLAANDLLDSRDVIIDELSKLININVLTDQMGAANVSIGGIQALDTTGYVEFEATEINGKLTLVTKDTKIRISLTGGELAGLSKVYSERIPEYTSMLDSIANQIVGQVNTTHEKGYSLENPPETGISFFEGYSQGELKINESVLLDTNKIAVSKDGSSGNGQFAVDIANIANLKILDGLTLGDNYSKMIAKLGSDKQTCDRYAESTELVIQQLEQQKGSISGVSIDEEMTNIIKYQRSFDASARLISIADKMLETLINMV